MNVSYRIQDKKVLKVTPDGPRRQPLPDGALHDSRVTVAQLLDALGVMPNGWTVQWVGMKDDGTVIVSVAEPKAR
jgi:hypothetical protein